VVDELRLRLGRAKTLHQMPVVAGRGSRAIGTGKIIAGAALIATAIVAPYLAPAAIGIEAAGAVTIAGISTATIGLTGVALVLSGVSVLMTRAPATRGPAVNDASFLFGGSSTNFAAQGGCVPVGFGRFRYKPKLINSSPPGSIPAACRLARWAAAAGSPRGRYVFDCDGRKVATLLGPMRDPGYRLAVVKPTAEARP
jgi:predicted phage tail protein